MNEQQRNWSVSSEITFIDSLGRWSNVQRTRRELLQGYIKGLALRRIGFVGLEIQTIRQYAEDALAKEMAV